MIFQDNFTDADGTPLTDRGWETADIGGFEVQNNKAQYDGTQAANRQTVNTGENNCVISVDIVIGTGGTNTKAGMFFRSVDPTLPSSDGWGCWLDPDSNQFRLFTINSGATTTQDASAMTINGGESINLEIILEGDSVTANVTGDLSGTLSAVNSAHQNETRHGLYSINVGETTPNTFDNFTVQELIQLTEPDDKKVFQRRPQARTIFEDQFNTGEDGDDLTTRGWDAPETGGFEVQSKKAQRIADVVNRQTVSTQVSNCTISVDIVLGSGGTNAAPGLFFRSPINVPLDSIYARVNRSDGELQLLQQVDGVSTELDSTPVTVSGGESFTMTAVLDGDSITVTVSGDINASVSATSSLFLTDKAHGLYSVDNGTVNTFDNFKITAQDVISIDGTYLGTPDHIQYRIVEHGTDTEVVGWTTLDISPEGETFSRTVFVTEGGWYNIDVRSRDSSNNVLYTHESTNRVGVGAVVAILGQDNATNWFDETSGGLTLDDLVSVYPGWTTTTGDGAITFGNTLSSDLGDIPVGLLDLGVSDSALREEASTGDYWLDPTGPLQTFLDAEEGLEAIVWIQGERDALSEDVTEAMYHGLGTEGDGLEDLFAQFPQVPIITVTLGRGTAGTDTDFQAIRNAQMEVDQSVSRVTLVSAYDLALADAIHLTTDGYQEIATRCVAAVTGDTSPKALTVLRSVNSLEWTLRYDQELAADTTYSLEGWRIEEGGSPLTINSVTQIDNQSVKIVLDSPPSDPEAVTIYHQYGAGDSGSVLDYPIGTNGLVAEPFKATVAFLCQ